MYIVRSALPGAESVRAFSCKMAAVRPRGLDCIPDVVPSSVADASFLLLHVPGTVCFMHVVEERGCRVSKGHAADTG
jgi:hypothetical protein